MKQKILFTGIILILFMLIVCLYIHIHSEDNGVIFEKDRSSEDMENKEETINDEIDKRYKEYRKHLSKYRIGVPKPNYEKLNDRIHQAPSPSDIHKSTLPKGCNKMFIKASPGDEYIDLMNGGRKVTYISRNRYETG